MKSIQIGDAAQFQAALQRHPSISCEQSWANLFLWSVIYDTQWEEREGRILLYCPKESCWHFPLGEWPAPEQLAQWCPGTIYDVPPDYPAPAGMWDDTADPDQADYIYSNAHLFESGGERLRKKRNLAKQFVAANPAWSLEAITPANLERAAALAAHLNAIHPPAEFLEEENIVLACAWEHFFAPELALSGVILYAAADQPAGFAVYSPLGHSTADIHFEKADHSIKGAPQQLTRELAGLLAPRYRWMNREQDMGEPGLRQAKLSLDPAFLFERVVLRHV